jgi:hypothetical protein
VFWDNWNYLSPAEALMLTFRLRCHERDGYGEIWGGCSGGVDLNSIL